MDSELLLLPSCAFLVVSAVADDINTSASSMETEKYVVISSENPLS